MASNLVVYADEYSDTGTAPAVLFFYDAGGMDAGNLLASVAYETNFQQPSSGYISANYAYDTSGNLINYFSRQRPSVVAIGPDGRCYAASAPISVAPDTPTGYFVEYQLDFFRVYRPDGNRIPFPQLHGARIRAIVLDSAGNLYVGGDTLDETDHFVGGKYNASGTLQWRMVGSPRVPDSPYSSGRRDTIYSIAVDSGGNIYTAGGNDYEYGVLKKYNSSGVVQWTRYPNMIILSVVVDSSGNVYTSHPDQDGANGQFSGGVTYADFVPFTPEETFFRVVKWDSSGMFVAGLALPDSVSLGTNLFAGVGQLEVVWRETYFRYWNSYDYDLSVAATNTYDQMMLVVAPDGTVYPNPLPPYTSYNTEGGMSVAVVETGQVMSLALPVQLGSVITLGDRYVAVPALAIQIGIAQPLITLEYAGAAAAVYRLYLTGGSGTIELSLASLQMRRNATSTWLSVVVPSPTLAILTAVEDRADGDLIVMRGVRFPNGTEQIESFFRAAYTASRYDVGGRSASLTLEATEISAVSTGYTRMARGVSYRAASQGQRRVRCAVDTYLRPGDLLDLGGGELMTVGGLSYQINPTNAVMEVSEIA